MLHKLRSVQKARDLPKNCNGPKGNWKFSRFPPTYPCLFPSTLQLGWNNPLCQVSPPCKLTRVDESALVTKAEHPFPYLVVSRCGVEGWRRDCAAGG